MIEKRKPLVVGLTGAIGAGKTTVARLLRARGITVIDADELGRRVLEEGAVPAAALEREFGATIFKDDGSVDRKALAREAFRSADSAAALNELIHPALWEALRQEIAIHGEESIIVIDAALIVEWEAEVPVGVVVVVEAPEAIRRERSRVKYGPADFEARQARQLDVKAKRAAAHVIIDNSGAEEKLGPKIEALVGILGRLAAGEPLPPSPTEL
ncbi:MAG: dephospho-CoA kinase [Candidatus Coatesbacteria bacterium]|nr:MAG: dephospho-CoA kinase [Candidatus Coatesbacteria bacterium]